MTDYPTVADWPKNWPDAALPDNGETCAICHQGGINMHVPPIDVNGFYAHIGCFLDQIKDRIREASYDHE